MDLLILCAFLSGVLKKNIIYLKRSVATSSYWTKMKANCLLCEHWNCTLVVTFGARAWTVETLNLGGGFQVSTHTFTCPIAAQYSYQSWCLPLRWTMRWTIKAELMRKNKLLNVHQCDKIYLKWEKASLGKIHVIFHLCLLPAQVL